MHIRACRATDMANKGYSVFDIMEAGQCESRDDMKPYIRPDAVDKQVQALIEQSDGEDQ